jgi:DNA-binding HxlR family transcriptional regulator
VPVVVVGGGGGAIGRRSACPLNASVEMLGDRWSLLILRDMMIRGARSFKDFLASPERIATNILAGRLRALAASGIITARADPSDRRRTLYLLTEKGIDLAPLMAEMVLWAARHECTGNQELVEMLRADKQAVIDGVRRRWEERVDALTARVRRS